MSQKRIPLLIVSILCLQMLVATAHGQDSTYRDPALLENIVLEIKAGWENADAKPFEKHFLDFEGARYVETGGQNEGLRDLIDHYVVPEGGFLEDLTLSFLNIETHFEGDFAWAIADVSVKATVKSDGRIIDKTGYETFLFRYVDESWKVVHTHSSTRNAKR